MAARKKIAVFVDRDGTICFDKHYLSDPDGLEFIPTVPEGIKRLNEAKILVIVVTNQSGIGRGYFTEQDLSKMHERLREMLSKHGAKVDDIIYCPHKPDEGCACRKPKPGMLFKARDKHGIELRGSFVVGDRMMDVEMAHSVGAFGILVPEPGDQYNVDKEVSSSRDKPDFRTDSFSKAVEWVLRRAK